MKTPAFNFNNNLRCPACDDFPAGDAPDCVPCICYLIMEESSPPPCPVCSLTPCLCAPHEDEFYGGYGTD